MSRQRVLIAGCGAVGTALGLRLAAEGHTVFGLRRNAAGLPSPIRAVTADLTQSDSLRSLPGEIGILVYTAAADGGDDAAYRAAYVEGLRNALVALQPRRAVFTSSTGVYAQQDGEWVDEDSVTAPTHHSGLRLLEGERLLADSVQESVALRLGGIYGPGRTRLLTSVREGRATIRSGPPAYTNRIHVDDCAGALAHLAFLPSPARCYVGVDHDPAAEREVLCGLATRLGVPPPRTVDPGLDEPAASDRRGRSNKRCRNARLLAAGFAFRYPSWREGYEAILRGVGLLLAMLLVGLGTAAPSHATGPLRVPAFTTSLHADHPLVGTIWDVAAGERIEPARLAERLAGERLVLVGERHDHPDHHALQAWVVSRLAQAGRRPVVAFEMLDAGQEASLRQHLSVSPTDAAGLGAAVGWEESGWPDWALYRPIAEAALAAGLELRSANLGRAETKALSRGGPGALSPALVERLHLGAALPDAQRVAIEAEITLGHCGHAPTGALPRMVEVQRARDAYMAATLRDAASTPRESGQASDPRETPRPPDGAILIAGNGHVRRDHAVPARLREQDPALRPVSVAILEVIPGREVAGSYAWSPWSDAAGAAPDPTASGPLFDYLWFTPRQDDTDPCEKFRKQLEGMKRPSSGT